jgi:hypothetical protein
MSLQPDVIGSVMEKRSLCVEPLRHRQTKGAATDRQNLRPPRHISTLPVPVIRGIEPLLALRFRAQTYFTLFPIVYCAMWLAALEFTDCIIFRNILDYLVSEPLPRSEKAVNSLFRAAET